jgi:large subunit ribosomal protein L17
LGAVIKEDNKMAMYRKLGKKTKLRKALLRNQVTALIYKGKIVTTEARAKEIKKIVEPMITLAAKYKDDYEEVTVQAKVARKDKDGKRVKEVVDGKRVTVFDTVEKKVKKDSPARLHARRQLMRYLYPVVEVPADGKGRRKNSKNVDLVEKLFTEYGTKYANRNGGYTRIIKIGQRRGDGAMEVVLEFV